MSSPEEIKKIKKEQDEKGFISALIWIIYLPGFLHAVAQGMIIPVLPAFADELTNLFQLVGLILAADFLGQVLSDVPTGYIAERIGRKRGMVIGLSIIAITTGLIFWSTTIWQLFLLRFTTGFGTALYSVSRHAWIADGVTIGARGRALSVFGGIGRLGRVVGPLIGGVIAVSFGQRQTFLLYFLIMLIPILVLIFVKENEGTSQASKNSHHNGEFIHILQSHWKVLLPAGAGAFFAQMVRSARQVVLPLFATAILGLDELQTGSIISASSLIDTALFPAAGLLMDRYGRKYAIVPSFVFQGVGVFFIAVATGYWGLLFAAALIGLGNGISAGTMMTLGADLSPADARGGFLGIWRLIGDAGFMTAPLVVGAIADALTLGAATIVLACSGGIASAIFLWFVPETLKQNSQIADTSPR